MTSPLSITDFAKQELGLSGSAPSGDGAGDPIGIIRQVATERGIKVSVPKNTTLLDALHTQRERFYGYDTLDLHLSQDETGRIDIRFEERAAGELPNAEQIEAAYDHDAHPNALMVEQKE